MMYSTSTYYEQRPRNKALSCDWQELRTQLIMRFNRLTLRELDEAGPNTLNIAQLIQHKHGVAPELAETYLRTIARNLGILPREMMPVRFNHA